MSRAWLRGFTFSFLLAVSLLIPFQNCGPAKLSGENSKSEGSLDGSQTGILPSTVGTKVDLNTLLIAPGENSTSILYPTFPRQSAYAKGSPLFENVLLTHNEFSKIEWIHAPSSTVIAMGPTLQGLTYSADLSGVIYAFGYRNQVPYLLTKLTLVDSGSSVLNLNSVGALTVDQKLMLADATSETIVVSFEAPSVSLSSIQYFLKNTNTTLDSRRAVAVTKKLSEVFDLEIRLKDASGQTLTKVVSLPAKIASVPTTTTLPPPPATTTTTTTLPVPTTTTTTTTLPVPFTFTALPTVSGINRTSATVTWSLSQPATGQVQFGLTSAYGKVTLFESSFNYSTHGQTPSGLTPGMVYHYRVVSSNAVGLSLMSADATFQTLPAPSGTLNMAAVQLESGNAYIITQNYGTIEDTNAAPFQSKLQIYENGVALPLAHAIHADIRSLGKGRFSHWSGALRFSSSDNTDPRTNGRTYTYQVLTAAPPMLACAAAVENTSANLTCPAGLVVKSVRFASWGTPTGICGTYADGTCAATNAYSFVSSQCPAGSASCSIFANNATLIDACYGTVKTLVYEAYCGAP
jgi:hypothetical protein